jgi:hypothetical protein
VLALTATAQDQSIYGIAEASHDNDGLVLHLVKQETDLQDKIIGIDNYTARAALIPPPVGGTAEGAVRLEQVRALLHDAALTDSKVFPVARTDQVIEAQVQERGETMITVVDRDPHHEQVLDRFPVRFQDPKDGAFAVTRSGRYVLLAGPDRICVWDVIGRRELDRNIGPLDQMLSQMIAKQGNPGDWWLTDDLRYIVVAPSQFVSTEAGEGGGDQPINIGHMTIKHPTEEGIIYDRQTRQISRFPTSVAALWASHVVDVESARGTITLLYSTYRAGRLTVAIGDISGHIRATHVLPGLRSKTVLGWNPKRAEIYFNVRDADSDAAVDRPLADDHIVIWDTLHDREQRFRLPAIQIQRAIEQDVSKN